MRLSLATRIFLGYAVVLVTFGGVSLFSVAEMRRSQVEHRLVSQGYLHLSQETAAIDTFHKNQAKDTERMLDERNVETRRALIRLARLYFPPLMSSRIAAGKERAHELLELAPPSEVKFIRQVEDRFDELSRRYQEYGRSAEGVFAALEAEQPDPAAVSGQMQALKQMEDSIGQDVRRLHASLETRIRQRVDESEERERRTGVAIIALSVIAIAVGLLATAWSARTLRPVRTLIEGVSRISRGDYSAKLGVRGDDEIAVLAREFDAMAKALQEREAQLKEKQEALLRAEQLAAVGRVSAQVAHEVRNPLSSIGLNVELLEEALTRAQFIREGDAREVRDVLAAVTREVDRLTEITEEYLRMARLPRPALAPEDLNEVLGNVLDFAREELQRARVQVERQLDAATPRALADEGQMRQVFLNLVRNSREAMDGGGRLTVQSRAVNGEVEVTFTDTGRGMTRDVQEHIFEPFFSTKEGGTGLGLAVARQILHAHHGSIRCESTPVAGTTFVVSLPRAAS
ncbi:MAG TPA: ATP-binding protein [Myxococcaceae bacterium]|nr:ATP-binding protein [Myxococcaceae bacterium]